MRRAEEPDGPDPEIVDYVAMRVGLSRGLRTSPIDTERVRNMEDAEAVAEKPDMFRDRPDPLNILLSGQKHGRMRNVVYAPTIDCREAARLGPDAEEPPSLGCLNDLVRWKRYETDDTVTAMKVLYFFTGFPLWKNLEELRVVGLEKEGASPFLWALGWLRWVGHRPARLDSALKRLTPRERRTLRRAVTRWWHRPGWDDVHTLMTRIMETRFVDLCPPCRDPHGLPRRGCFRSEHLWRLNAAAATRRNLG